MIKSIFTFFFLFVLLAPPFTAYARERTPSPEDGSAVETAAVPLLPAANAAAENGAAKPGKDTDGIFDTFARRLISIWNSGEYDLYLPVYSWHNRLAYDKSKIQKYNELPWGGGFGRSFRDEDGDDHFLFLMGFQDSYDRFEPYGGYGFMKRWHMDEEKTFSLGLGYSLGITARDQYDYIPIILPLPIAGVQYKNIALECAYIPGGHNNGNVLFTWLRWHFD